MINHREIRIPLLIAYDEKTVCKARKKVFQEFFHIFWDKSVKPVLERRVALVMRLEEHIQVVREQIGCYFMKGLENTILTTSVLISINEYLQVSCYSETLDFNLIQPYAVSVQSTGGSQVGQRAQISLSANHK